jgi:hypothetical protein
MRKELGMAKERWDGKRAGRRKKGAGDQKKGER